MASTSAAEPSSALKESPNWLEMPHDLMLIVFQRLRTMDILSARRVCTSWRRISNDPAFWKVVYVLKPLDSCETNYSFEILTKQAVNLSRGELIDISIVSFGSNDLLDYIVLRSSKLKRLFLHSCYDMTGSGLSRAVKGLPQLEELHLFSIYINALDIKFIGRNYPQLKSFKISDAISLWEYDPCDNQAVAIANNMPKLRHLQIYGDEMTDIGVQALLNGCPHLESLRIHMFSRFFLDRNLLKLCTERIKDFKHN